MATANGGLRPLHRLPLLLLGFAALAVGTGSGLARMGVPMPDVAATAAAWHGPLMMCGFLGTVISLERAVAIGRGWAYAGPLCAGLGGLAIVAGFVQFAPWLVLGASVLLLAASLDIVARQRAMFTWTMAAGALSWAVGNALWAAGASVQSVVAWWLAFLVLTIAGERLELSRFLPPSAAARRTFGGIVGLVGAGLLTATWPWGQVLFGTGLVALAIWLLKQDVARRTVRARGLTRFMAMCMLSGYAWLAIGGAIVVAAGGLVPGTASYDAALHALGLGFVFSMVFGHAPVIVPSVVRAAVPYHATFYAPLFLLQLSLAARLWGDVTGDFDLRRGGGILNAVALATFILGTLGAVIRGKRSAARSGALAKGSGLVTRRVRRRRTR